MKRALGLLSMRFVFLGRNSVRFRPLERFTFERIDGFRKTLETAFALQLRWDDFLNSI